MAHLDVGPFEQVLMGQVLHEVLSSEKNARSRLQNDFIMRTTQRRQNIIYFLWVHSKRFGKIIPKLINSYGGRGRGVGVGREWRNSETANY